MLDLLMLVLPTTASVHHGRRQEFKVADLELAVFFDENDFEIEVGSKSSLFFISSTLMP
jgi:hypothetical protein